MTGVKWVRLDTNIWGNPKILSLIREGKYRPVAVYLFGLAYSGGQGNEGFIPEIALKVIHGSRNDAQILTTFGLWEAVPGGWNVHDWHEYQASNDTLALRSKRAQAAAQARWNREQ